MKKNIAKAILIIALLWGIGMALQSEYTEDVISCIPVEIYDQIVKENPDWNDKKIADYYMDNRKELNSKMRFISEIE